MPERDLFANFERMRRDMDQLFGDVFGRTPVGRHRSGFTPPVDVYFTQSDPPCAVIKADVAGIDAERLALEVRGRELTIAGERPPAESEGRQFQQIEIERGAFRRTIHLGVDVDPEQAKAVYEDGILRIQLPVVAPEPKARSVPIEVPHDDENGSHG